MDVLEDIRDRLVRIEEKLEKKFEDMDERIKPLEKHVNIMQAFGKFVAGTIAAGTAIITAWFTFLSTKTK